MRKLLPLPLISFLFIGLFSSSIPLHAEAICYTPSSQACYNQNCLNGGGNPQLEGCLSGCSDSACEEMSCFWAAFVCEERCRNQYPDSCASYCGCSNGLTASDCHLDIIFNRHETAPTSITITGYVMLLIGEPGRRGNERTVIGEMSNGHRDDLALWDPDLGTDGFGRWIVYSANPNPNDPNSQHYEDVRGKIVCN